MGGRIALPSAKETLAILPRAYRILVVVARILRQCGTGWLPCKYAFCLGFCTGFLKLLRDDNDSICGFCKSLAWREGEGGATHYVQCWARHCRRFSRFFNAPTDVRGLALFHYMCLPWGLLLC